MKVDTASEVFLQLREQRTWRLLAADKAPLYLAILQSVFNEETRSLASSVLAERVTRDLEILRGRGHVMPQPAQTYIAEWLAQGWLTRRLPEGASEEVLELTSDATNALRFVEAQHKPRSSATESRLAIVMQQVLRLAEETDTNPESRLAALQAERARIDQELAALQRGEFKTLPDDRALERIREILAQVQELVSDFRNVRDSFDRLNRELRQQLMENDGSRGNVLESLFAGVDLIAESEHGRTFAAFWRLLTDGAQSASLSDALDALGNRRFTRALDASDRKYLYNLTATLMSEGGEVQSVLQHFARSLKSFVQRRDFLEQRRLHALLRQAQHAALEAKDYVKPNEDIGYTLSMTGSSIRSASQWHLHDPELDAPALSIEDAHIADVSLEEVQAMLMRSEIDMRTLRANIVRLLSVHSQVSIAEILEAFPCTQGLGSIMGYVALGRKHGELQDTHQTISWEGLDGTTRSARLPVIYFVKERIGEFIWTSQCRERSPSFGR